MLAHLYYALTSRNIVKNFQVLPALELGQDNRIIRFLSAAQPRCGCSVHRTADRPIILTETVELNLFFAKFDSFYSLELLVTPSFLKMPRMRGTTRKILGSSRGGSSASQPLEASSPQALQRERTRPAAPVRQTRSVRQKVVHGKGKGPAPETESEESSEEESSNESESEMGAPDRTEDDLIDPPGTPIDLHLLSADDYAIKRHVNQYLFKSDSLNPRFHTVFQEQVYEQLYDRHKKFADHKWIKWPHINALDKYSGVYQLFHRVGLHDFVGIKQNYDDKLIRQFYATLHITPDLNSFRWISGTRSLESTKEDFERVLRIQSSSWEKIFASPALLVPVWSKYYDSSVKCKLGTITGLKPEVSMINRIINHTFYPKSGNFDAVRGHVWNMIDHIMEGTKFDVVDVILKGIASSKNDRVKRIYYAPYIMALIMRKMEYRGGLGSAHKNYKPRDGIPPRRDIEADPVAVDAPPAVDAPAEGILAQVLQNQQLILSTLQEMKTDQNETRNRLLRMESTQNGFFNETHNRISALIECFTDLENFLRTPQRFARRPPQSLRASTSSDPPPLVPVSTPPAPAPATELASQDPTPAPTPAPAHDPVLPPQDPVLPPQDPAV